MTPDKAKRVLDHARTIAEQAAEVCKEGDEINNQVTVSSLMLATCIMGRFFDEDKEVLLKLLMTMLVAVEQMPIGDEFEHPIQ